MSAPAAARFKCRECSTARRFRFVGYATDATGDERPRPEIRVCETCGHQTLRLGDLTDATNLVEATVRKRIGRTSKVDPEDACAYLAEQLWRLYRGWKPARLSFTSYASYWLPRRLDDWIGKATGGVTRGGRRRSTIQPEFGELDEDTVGVGDEQSRVAAATGELVERDRLASALGRSQADYEHDRAGDLLRVLTGGDREGAERDRRDGLPEGSRAA